MTNLNQQISDLKKEYKLKNSKLRLENKIKKSTKIENVIIYDLDKFSFFWHGSKATKKDILKIIKKYPISKDKANDTQVKFAGKDSLQTDSNVFLTWQNYDHTNDKGLKINYTSDKGYKISINIANDFYPNQYSFWKVKRGQHLGFGRYEETNNFYIDTPFYLQRYAGGSCKYYFLEGAERLTEYINFIFTGEFIYDNEIKTNF